VANDLGSASVLYSSLRLAHQRHGPDTVSHFSADAANPAPASTKIDAVVAALFDVITAASPISPAGESSGALRAMHAYGFRSTG
jgi:hypothetical protein